MPQGDVVTALENTASVQLIFAPVTVENAQQSKPMARLRRLA